MKTWIISELFYPDEVATGYYLTEISKKLNEEGRVSVICGPTNYQSKSLRTNIPLSKEIEIYRVSSLNFNKNHIIQRILKAITFSFAVFFYGVFKINKHDKVLVITNPPILIPIIYLIKKIKKIKYYVLIHDLFPDNAITGRLLKNNILIQIINKIFNLSYNNAEKIIVVGDDMKKILINRTKSKVVKIPNWSDINKVKPSSYNNVTACQMYGDNVENKIIIQFAGNHGRVQGLKRLLLNFIKLKNKNIVIVFIGDGAVKSDLIKISKSNLNNNIIFLDSRPREEQIKFLNNSHIGLVSLMEGMYGLGVPSKFYNIISSGRPVLYVGDKGSEIYEIIKEFDIGWAFSWDELDELDVFLNSISNFNLNEIHKKGKNARIIAETKFSKEVILKKYLNILK